MAKRNARYGAYIPQYARPQYSTRATLDEGINGNIWLQSAMRLWEYLIAALFGFFVLERCNLGGTDSVLQWIAEKPGLAFVAILSLIAVYSVFRAFFNTPFIPFALYGALVCLAGVANYYKLFYRSEPLVPYDIFNVGPAFAIMGNMGMRFDRGLTLNLLFFGLLVLIAYLASRFLYKPIPVHGVLRALISFCLATVVLLYFTDIFRLQPFGIFDSRFDQYRNYQINGFTVSTLMNLADGGVKPPEGYSPEQMEALRQIIERAPHPPSLGRPPKKPHIIVLQMEAYGDPRLIDSRISYQIEPFAALLPYREQVQRFHTLTSVMGGGTSNTEFEFLTGYNNYFLPAGVTPFIRYMNRPKPSLATDLSAMGYRTVAMHPHAGSFYSRDTAYPRLGFDRLVTIDAFEEAAYVGHYVSDASFGEKVIELFEEERAEGPVFLYGISIQNHGPYYDEEYLEVYPAFHRFYPVRAGGGLVLDGIQTIELEIYGANLRDASIMLADMLDYFAQVDEPVLLLVFGDHQASWSWALDLPGSPELELRRYSTESFFWAN